MGRNAASPRFRCAIYTRKSSEEGLDQSFNSLHAQREACEAYVLSQAAEGWKTLTTLYDDPAFSGGTMERPALQRLLADIGRGLIDIVVVYKVDRLTRSLTDFAKIVEVFDGHGASFVSVTQAFNTTTSMGRLTLNVLLSFAQFEREVTGERIRDKIAASKQKGMWMGGSAPLGYDPPTDRTSRALVVNEAEATLVRQIFERYLELKSVHRLREALTATGVRSKIRVTKSGQAYGGREFARGALFHLLQNRTYLGETVHKDRSYPGQHPAIVQMEVFDLAQQQLAENRRLRGQPSTERRRCVLSGKLFDESGEPMSPTFAKGKSGRRYRYYVSAPLQQGRKGEAATGIRRLAAAGLESFMLERLVRLANLGSGAGWSVAGRLLQRIDVRDDGAIVQLGAKRLSRTGDDDQAILQRLRQMLEQGERAWLTEEAQLAVFVPVRLVLRGGRSWLVNPSGQAAQRRAPPNRALVAGLRRAHALVRSANLSPLQEPAALFQAKAIADPYERNLARVAYLAPDIQQAILEGRQPPGLTLQSLMMAEPPVSWAEQRRRFGFA